MMPGSFRFGGKWMAAVQSLGETGMGYVIVTITLVDGRTYKQVIIDSGWLLRIRGVPNIPFSEDDIASIKQTDDRWDWSAAP